MGIKSKEHHFNQTPQLQTATGPENKVTLKTKKNSLTPNSGYVYIQPNNP